MNDNTFIAACIVEAATQFNEQTVDDVCEYCAARGGNHENGCLRYG